MTATYAWCPCCGEVLFVDEVTPLLEREHIAAEHLSTNHPIRYWLYRATRWNKVLTWRTASPDLEVEA